MPRNPDCTLCELSSGDVRQVCMSGRQVGQHSDVLVVGQSPWKEEDQRGLPFVGESGDLVNPALARLGVTDYYLTNVVKCAPFLTNGKVTSAHIKACAPYLDEELGEQKPKYILALGNEAIERLLGRREITKIAGKEQWSEKYQAWIFPTLHPAAILRGRGRESSWRLDLTRFAALTQGRLLDRPPVDVREANTVDEAVDLFDQLSKARRIAYDFEANPLPWWHKNYLAYTLAFTWEQGRSVVLPLFHPESPFGPKTVRAILRALVPIMQNPAIQKGAWNGGGYDDLVFYRLTGALPYTTCDPMVGYHVLDENAPKALKWNGMAHLGWPDWDIDARKYHPLDQLSQYNGYDTAAEWELWERMDAQLAESPQLERYFYRIVMPMVRAVERMVVRGVHVDRHVLAGELWKTHRKYREIAKEIPVENPNSYQQIAEWLFEREKLPPVRMTAGGSWSTDEDSIHRLAMRFPQALRVLEYRHPRKMEGTYLRPAVQFLRESCDGRIHPEYRTTSTRTGRLSSGFHTTPRESGIRSIYAAPPGRVLIQADYRQIEARLVAWIAAGRPKTLAGATGMLGAFRDGRDVYVETAAHNLGRTAEQITPDDRQNMGKVPTLAMIYSISPKGLREYAWKEYQLLWNEGQTMRYWRNFYDLWPEIHRWHRREEQVIRHRGWVRTDIGRVRRLPDAFSRGAVSAEAVRQGINAIVQPLASDITQRAAALLEETLPPQAGIVANVHDALNVEADGEGADEVADLVQRAMVCAPLSLRDLGLELPRGLITVDVKIGTHWGSGEYVLLL